ncbi:MAG: Asp-tRNA(Asn)/Glu-tRNA(Gln) amidotransferase subunit GatC [Pseudomonadales bacterium]|nr:Asp-tRNA(Asn)/Glu-tRNA(Gln) amidotransferase subunit GatC [Pseudomonadales bacterium]
MKVDHEVIQTVAELSQLKIDPADLENYAQGMTQVLDLAGRMQAIDTQGVAPMSNPLDATQRLRPDVVTETNQREAFQAIAPETEDGLYLVPRVVE